MRINERLTIENDEDGTVYQLYGKQDQKIVSTFCDHPYLKKIAYKLTLDSDSDQLPKAIIFQAPFKGKIYTFEYISDWDAWYIFYIEKAF